MYQKNFEALKNLKKPKAVIFDWDNTLVDTWPLICAAINITMKAMQKEEWSLKKVKDTVHKSMRESFPEIFGDRWQEAGEIYKNTYRSINLTNLQFLPSALDLLNKLQEKNILQMVVSNKIGSTLRKEIKSLKIEDKFFSAVGSTDASYDKPHRAPVELALSASDVELEKDHIWFVGDTIADVDCAFNIGCQAIVYGHADVVSKTISDDVLSGQKNNSQPLPLYFNHQELIKIIDQF